ncbi:MAG: cupin domain-containing protein [Akkermansiaceae bacterium]|nr:cupin domain-containing protein [Armatimonadota bacterium]
MRKIAFSALPETPLPAEVGSVLRRFTGGGNITVAKITFAAGSVLPGHRHVNEQFTIVLDGTLEFVDDAGNTTPVGAGEVMHLPGNFWHGAKALSDATVIDVFSPVRGDWGTPPEPIL